MSELPDVTIRGATAADLAGVRDLLLAGKLPLDGLEEQFGDSYAVAVLGDRIVGAEGIECYEGCGLLRSAVVDAAWRGRRIGDRLTSDRLRWARAAGLREVWLLTTSAADYFPRFGFQRAERGEASPALQRSREFAEACPASAVAMRLSLAD